MRSRHAWVHPGLGILVAGLGVVQQLGSPADTHLAVALCACLLGGGAVAVLPAAPLAGLGALLVVDAGYQVAFGDPPFATFLATMIAMYHLARAATRRTMLTGYAATLAALVVMDVVVSVRGLDSPAGVIIPIVYFAAAAGLGALVRHTANYARIARERTEALEREQAHLAELAAATERARIARELHDVISHSVSLMVLQAEAAREVVDAHPDRAAQTLDVIGDTGRRAIGDLRQLLGVLRSDEDAVPVDLGALVEPVRATGLAVELIESGEPIPAPLRATAYRVVQEALTNTLKHAAASKVVVTVTHDAGGVTLEVVDDGAGTPQPAAGSGRGLAGMAERVQVLGGTLSTQHLTPHGFRVLAQLPVCE
ncbi:sensor histidine kinase [Planosporangium thailandense]|uniref:histidine kinase n=1 Tax=Planosporangium thailandense TaxID=765197 RepID=A0ABX0Y9N1_9ACTN|nr:sensor histidine kinase [Planosporangium thailandense]NJC73929.1 sensor histidine kinase [Planosporangium thailandense]